MNFKKRKRKLYAKLYLWAKQKYRDVHLDTYYNDIKCPNCNEWFSITGIQHKHQYVKPEPWFGYAVECGNCKHLSYWNCVAFPFPARCKDNGDPIL